MSDTKIQDMLNDVFSHIEQPETNSFGSMFKVKTHQKAKRSETLKKTLSGINKTVTKRVLTYNPVLDGSWDGIGGDSGQKILQSQTIRRNLQFTTQDEDLGASINSLIPDEVDEDDAQNRVAKGGVGHNGGPALDDDVQPFTGTIDTPDCEDEGPFEWPDSLSGLRVRGGHYVIPEGRMLPHTIEKELIFEYQQTGSSKASHALYEAHKQFMFSRIRTHSMTKNADAGNLDELRSVMIEAFMECLDRYELDRGLRLNTALRTFIHNKMTAYMLANTDQVRRGTSNSDRNAIFRTNKTIIAMEGELGRPLTHEDHPELARRVDAKLEDVQNIIYRHQNGDVAMDGGLHDGDASNGDYLMAIAGGTGTDMSRYAVDGASVEADRVERDQKEALDIFMQNLNERQKFVLEARFNNDPPTRYNVIGQCIGVSPERARQIFNSTLQLIRAEADRHEITISDLLTV